MSTRNYDFVTSVSTFSKLVDRITRDGTPFAFDIETGYNGVPREKIALLPFHPDWILVGFSFTNSIDWARYIPIAHDAGGNIDDPVEAARLLWKLLHVTDAEGKPMGVAHNAAFELKGLRR